MSIIRNMVENDSHSHPKFLNLVAQEDGAAQRTGLGNPRVGDDRVGDHRVGTPGYNDTKSAFADCGLGFSAPHENAEAAKRSACPLCGSAALRETVCAYSASRSFMRMRT